MPVGATNEQLIYELDQLTGIESAIRVRRLEIIAELDRRKAHEEDGMATIVDWLVYRYRSSRRTASHEVQLAHELGDLPCVRTAASEGLICWDITKALASFVTPSDEQGWTERAQVLTYREVRNAACTARRRREIEDKGSLESDLKLDVDHELGARTLQGRLMGGDGETVHTALAHMALSFGRNHSGGWDPMSKNLAQALVMICRNYLGEHFDNPAALVTVHVTEDALRSSDGLARYPTGLIVSAEEARELMCDGWVQTVIHDANGMVVGVGDRRRTVPPSTMRELKLRDECCVLCGGASFLQAHHVQHREHDGDNSLANLVLLCWRCHTVLHRKGFRLKRRENGEVLLIHPDGTPVRNRPEPLKPIYRERILGPPIGAG